MMLAARFRHRFTLNPVTTSAPRDRKSTGDLEGPKAMRFSEYERLKEAGTLPPGTTAPVAPAIEPAEARQSTGGGCLVALGDFFGGRLSERLDLGTPGFVPAASPTVNGMPRP